MLTGMNGIERKERERGTFRGDAAKSAMTRETRATRMSAPEKASPRRAPCAEFSGISWHRHASSLHTKSLTDLTETRRRRGDWRRTKSWTDVTCHATDFVGRDDFGASAGRSEAAKTNEASRRVISLLMLNAWRRRREDNEKARAIVKTLSNEVGNLNMQVYVLRKLLDNKKTQTLSAARDLQKQLSKIEKYEEEKKSILKEKESLECEVKDLQDVISDLQSKCKNLENDLDTARLEAETWELTLKKERKKLKAVKEENAALQKDGESKEYQLDYQSQCLEELKNTIKELQQELDTQVPLLKEAMTQIQSAEEKLKLSDEMGMEQEKTIIEKELEIKRLKAEIALAEQKFQQQDERNGELGKLVSEKTKELAIINEKLEEFAKSEKFWMKRMVKVASLCTRIPVACFYTVATLLLPQPWYRIL